MKYASQDPGEGSLHGCLGSTMICDKESNTSPISHAIHTQKTKGTSGPITPAIDWLCLFFLHRLLTLGSTSFVSAYRQEIVSRARARIVLMRLLGR